ncbi:hypothetical protein JL720_8832 [Aureococcus anophagefferens]|nr:hypothetical protein JL720_8832 [Aureococcus anophagefferens]
MSQHVDRRDQFVRALWRHADTLRSAEHQAAARTSAVTALVRIGVHPEPLRSVAQARRKSATTSPAPLRALVDEANGLLERGRRFRSLEAMAAGACGAWAQMTPLEGALKYVKRRSRVNLEGGCAFELTAAGARAGGPRDRRGTGGDAVGALRSWVDGVYPMLLERKSAVDVADSLRDGRWAKQHDAMRRTADRFPGGAALVYVVEGDPARHVHTACGCGCLGVGSCGNPNLAAVAAAADARERSGVEIADARRPRDGAPRRGALPRGAGGLLRRRARAAGVAADDARQAQARRDARVSAGEKPTTGPSAAAVAAWTARDPAALGKLTGPQLKLLCEAVGEATSGAKRELVARLLLPPMPKVLVDRKARKLYVPRDRSCPMALLCALDAAARTGAGPLSKDDWMARAERCGVASVSLYEKSGPMQYDGWSSCNGQLCSGQPSLVAKVNPGARYELGRLATAECASGRDVAAALHAKAHAGAPARPRRPPATPRRRLWPSAPPPPGGAAPSPRSSRRRGRAAAAAVAAARPPARPRRRRRRRRSVMDLTSARPASDTPDSSVMDLTSPPAPPSARSDASDDVMDLTFSPDNSQQEPPPRRGSLIDLTAPARAPGRPGARRPGTRAEIRAEMAAEVEREALAAGGDGERERQSMALAATGVSMAPAESTAAASARTVSFGGLPPPPDDGVRERHSWRLGPKGSASVSMPALHSVGSSNADTLLSSSTTGSIRRRSKRDDDDGGAAGEPERRTIFFQRIPHQRTGAPDEEQQRSPSSTLLYAQDLLVAALDAPRLATWIMASSGLWRFMGEWKPGQQKRAKFPTSKAHISAGFHSFRLIFGRAIISRNGLEAWRYAPVYEAFFLAGFGACGLACLGNAFLAATPYHTLPMSLLTAYVHVPAVHGFRFWRRTLNDVRSSGLVNSLVAHESSVVGAAVKNIGIGLRCTVVGQACFVVVVLAAYALPATPLGDFGATAPRTGASGVDVAAVRAHGLLMWVFITMVMCAITGQYALFALSELSAEVSRGGAYARYDLDELLEDVAATCGATQASLTRSSDAWSSILIHFLLVAFAQTFVVLNHVTLHTVGELKHTPYGYCYYFQDAFFVGSAGLVIFSTVVFAASVTSKCREVGMSCFGHPVDQQKVAMILFAYTMLVLNSVIAILARRYNVGSPRRALAP